MKHDFPVYKKSRTGNNFYKVESDDVVIEKQLIGKRVFEYTIVAKQYPEMLVINSILNEEGYEDSDQEEFESVGSELL